MVLRNAAACAGLAIYVACSAALPLQSAAEFPAGPSPRTDDRGADSPPLHGAPSKDALTEFLTEISDWIMTTGVGTNVLNNASYFGTLDSIFINGALLRATVGID